MSSHSVNLKLHPKQQEAFKHLLDPSVHTCLFGGSVSLGKTRLLCLFILWSAITFEGTRYLIGRKRLTDLRSSTLVTLMDVAKEMGIHSTLDFNQTLNTITLHNGSVILLRQLDVKPSDPEMVELGSIELTAAAVDEIGEIDEVVYTTLLQRIRYKLPAHGGKILLVSNPTKNWAYRRIYIPWEQKTLPSHTKYVGGVPSDNPFNSPSYIATLTLENLGPEMYFSRVIGDWHYATGDSDLFIESDLINACNWDTQGINTRGKILSIDVASKTGADSTVAMLFDGNVLSRVWSWKGKDTVELEKLIRQIIADYSVPIRSVVVDAIGVGVGLSDMLRGCYHFKANHRALNDEAFGSLRDQTYYKAAELVSRGFIRIKTDGDVAQQLISELCAHKRHSSGQGSGPARVTPKDQVSRSLGGASPDFSDAFTMAMVPLALQRRELTVDVIRF